MQPVKGLSKALGAASGSAPMPSMSKMPTIPAAPAMPEEEQEGGDLQRAMELMQQAMEIISSYTEEDQSEAEYE